jgi:thioredoxin 1
MNVKSFLSKVIVIAGVAAFSIAVASTNKDTTVKKASVAPNKEILFFMNPNGHPCQMQNAILNGIKDSLAGLATIKYYKTTEDADRDAFGKYGIRGLPTLVIADSKGNEISRFTPGIQDKETILSTLHSLKSK